MNRSFDSSKRVLILAFSVDRGAKEILKLHSFASQNEETSTEADNEGQN